MPLSLGNALYKLISCDYADDDDDDVRKDVCLFIFSSNEPIVSQ